MQQEGIKPSLLTKAELQWLLGDSNPSPGQAHFMRFSIRHKLDVFQKLEVPLLTETGYLKTLGVSAGTNAVSAGTNAHPALVSEDWQSEGGVNLAVVNETSPRRDSDARPKVSAPKAENDLRFTKPSLCQAELLGQNIRNFWCSLFNA